MLSVIRCGILHSPALDAATGDALRYFLTHSGAGDDAPRFIVTHESYVAEQRNWLEDVLVRWCDEEELDLLLTVGGVMPAAGPSGRELVPQATLAIVDRLLPGLAEAMRAHGGEFSELALLTRGVAGIRSQTLILNLPGGSGPAVCFLEAVAHLIGPVVAHLQGAPAAPRLEDEIEYNIADDNAIAGDNPGQDDLSGATAFEEETVEEETGDAPSAGKLDAKEFAEFLRRKK